MPYMGEIKAKKDVVIELLLDHSASGPALLWAAWAGDDGKEGSGRAVVDPGNTGAVPLGKPSPGLLEIEVDMTDDDDTGRLRVTVGGTEVASEKIEGDTFWSFTVA